MVSAAGPCPLLVPSASLRSLSSSASLCACSQGDEQRDAQEGHHGGHREDLHGGEEGRARGAPCGAQCRVSEQMRARRACAAKGCGTRTHAPHARNGERRSQGNGIARTHSHCCTCACLSLGGGACGVCVWLRFACRGRGGNYGRVGITARVNLGCANSVPSLSCRIQILHALNRDDRDSRMP